MKTLAAHATRAALLAATLFGASAALAAPITIDLSGSPTSSAYATGTTRSGDYSWLKFSNGGVETTAVAGYKNGSTYTEGNANNYPTLGFWSGNGLGVWSDKYDGEHTVDNKGGFEYVRFSFDQNVAIQSVTISCLSCDLHLGADAAYLLGDLPGTWSEVSGPAGTLPTYTFNLNLTSYDDVFRFGASQIVTEVQVEDGGKSVDGNKDNGAECKEYYTSGRKKGQCKEYKDVWVPKYKTVKQYDDFKIKAITFLTEPPAACTGPDCDPAQVPEPSTLSILGLGALALASRIRRRKA